MTRTAVINQKGGVGKTTTTVNIGAALARRGHRVLLLDLDPQSNLTLHLDLRPEDAAGTVTSFFLEDRDLAGLVLETSTPGLHLLPADTSLAGVEQALANRIGRETLLREALDEFARVAEFDFVFIDCPPSLGVLSANALVAADKVLIPVQAEYLALQGMAKLTEVIQLVQRHLNPNLRVACILPCMVDLRTNLAAEVLGEIRRHFEGLLAQNFIRSNVKLAEAPSFGRTVFQHAPESNGARDYDVFAEEFLSRVEVRSVMDPEPGVEQQALDAMESLPERIHGRQAPAAAPHPAPRDATAGHRMPASAGDGPAAPDPGAEADAGVDIVTPGADLAVDLAEHPDGPGVSEVSADEGAPAGPEPPDPPSPEDPPDPRPEAGAEAEAQQPLPETGTPAAATPRSDASPSPPSSSGEQGLAGDSP